MIKMRKIVIVMRKRELFSKIFHIFRKNSVICTVKLKIVTDTCKNVLRAPCCVCLL